MFGSVAFSDAVDLVELCVKMM